MAQRAGHRVDWSDLPRPEVIVNEDGTLANPEGWSMVLIAADRQTVVAAWDDAGVFHQWEDTEVIVRQLMDALMDFQIALTQTLGRPAS